MATYTNEDLLDSVQRLNVPVCRIQMILDSGQVDVDCVDIYGFSSLHWASMMQRLDIAQLLINRGADVNHRNNKGGQDSSSLDCTRRGLSRDCQFFARLRSGRQPARPLRRYTALQGMFAWRYRYGALSTVPGSQFGNSQQ
jgi:Ankyrin repeats (many copies)